MLVFSLAGAPISVSQDATREVNLLYCRSPRLRNKKFKGAKDHGKKFRRRLAASFSGIVHWLPQVKN